MFKKLLLISVLMSSTFVYGQSVSNEEFKLAQYGQNLNMQGIVNDITDDLKVEANNYYEKTENKGLTISESSKSDGIQGLTIVAASEELGPKDVYFRLQAAIKVGDFDEIKKYVVKEKVDLLEASGEVEQTLEMLKTISPQDVKILSENFDGDAAMLMVTGIVWGNASTGTINFEKENGRWVVKLEDWKNSGAPAFSNSSSDQAIGGGASSQAAVVKVEYGKEYKVINLEYEKGLQGSNPKFLATVKNSGEKPVRNLDLIVNINGKNSHFFASGMGALLAPGEEHIFDVFTTYDSFVFSVKKGFTETHSIYDLDITVTSDDNENSFSKQIAITDLLATMDEQTLEITYE